jgi:hypothetical protein
MRRTIAALMTLGAIGALAGCVDAERSVTGSATATATGSAAIRIVAEQDADLHLWVSNQSFEDDPVGVRVTVDGVEVVRRPFAVEGQHNWILFPIEAPPGNHVVHAVSDTGAELRESFTLPEEGRRYAVVDYWYYPGDGDRQFTWRLQATPIGFD